MSSDASQGTADEPVRRGHAPVRADVGDSAGQAQRGSGGPSSLPPALLKEFSDNFRKSYRTLWTIAAGIVNDPAIAEDIVQEAALTALGKLHEFEPRSNYTAWMAKIVRFLALNQLRRGKRQPSSVDPVAIDDSVASRSENMARAAAQSPIDALGNLDDQRSPFDDRVLHALNSVSDIARACLLLRTVEGLNYDEISRALDIPPGTAMSHVHRTRMLLRERLSDLDPTARAVDKEGGSATA